MSERKESLLKYYSTKINSACPNTPSPFCGGLEGRRNLSNISFKKAQGSSKEKNKESFKVKSLKIRLTGRDEQIIDLLQKQDFCFYSDIKKKFFSSDASACNRLSKLQKQGHIVIEPVNLFSLKKTMDDPSLGLIGRNLKVISLSDKSFLKKRKSSDWKKTHQLLLFSVKERLEKLLSKEAVFENQIKDLTSTLYNGRYEPLPDFYIQGEDYKLAIELELHLKSRKLYFLKMAEYRRSRFTHVLYITAHIKKVERLIRAFQSRKYISIAHYSKLEEVISHRYGNLTLLEWLKKKTK